MKDEKEEINAELLKKYKLSNEEHEEMYLKIEKDVFNKKKSVENPVVFFIGGQPGSGKSGIISYSKNSFADENYLVINVDEYKKYHPKSEEIAMNYPTLYTTIISQETTDWTSRILKKAMEEKYNFIFEITLKDNKILDTLRKLKQNGYTIFIRALAVSNLESLMSIHERYQNKIENGERMRLARIVRHNIAYKNMPDVINNVENTKEWDSLEIYIRGKDFDKPELIYINSIENQNSIDNKIKEYDTAKSAVEEARKLNDYEVKKIKDRFNVLQKKFKERNTTEDEKNQLEELKSIIENYK